MPKDNPYLAEYARSSRAKCKACFSTIEQSTLRIAHMTQSAHFDGMQPNWFHYSCFFGRFRPLKVQDVTNFHSLRWDDQEKLRAQIERPDALPALSTGEGSAKVNAASKLVDFAVQYAKSNRSSCRKCGEKIQKEEIRLSKKKRDKERPHLGMIDNWHHVGCFVKRRKELGWKDEKFTIDMMQGFPGLDKRDQKALSDIFDKKSKKRKSRETKNENDDPEDENVVEVTPAPSAAPVEPKKKGRKPKKEKVEVQEEDEATKKLRSQNMLLWKTIDAISGVTKTHLRKILEHNEQEVPAGIERIRQAVVDGLLFGRLLPCTRCQGQLVAHETSYKCRGNISGWTACTYAPRQAERTKWEIPEEVAIEYAYMTRYRFKKQDRLFAPRNIQALKDKKIAYFGKLSKKTTQLKVEIEKMGGVVTTSISRAYCCISSPEEVAKGGKKVEDAELNDTFVVSCQFLDACKELDVDEESDQINLLPLLQKFSICSWGSEKKDTVKRNAMEEEKSGGGASKKMKLVVKNGAAVDPEADLDSDEGEVCSIKGVKHTSTLSMVDINKGWNSYYKLQLLKSTTKNRWYLFRAWGRVGTSIGGTKTDKFYSQKAGLEQFLFHYEDKTGNEFGCVDFEKKPNKFYPLEIDYGNDDDDKVRALSQAGANSKLPASVQLLVKAIFDIESMRQAMVEFELDLDKMPLGKLSNKQMRQAYTVLDKAMKLVESGETSGGGMADCTNRFYTLIPHSFGFEQPTPLDDLELIKAKIAMVENLMEIEYAYNMLNVKEEDKNEEEEEDVLDLHYRNLRCDIKPLCKKSEEYKTIVNYAELTHAKTHNEYKLVIEDVFKIERQGEEVKFKPFQMMKNHKLLWHGSRTTNYAGILSQGLRIAPKEAPVTGYMFGKGVYFADMVSKSANYCAANRQNPYGFALLADVALGNMLELTDSKFVRKLPRGKHSVMGLGRHVPDPSRHTTLDGVQVPMGPQTDRDMSQVKGGATSLLYNEYIVYDVAQIHMKYLVKFKFDYGSLW